jgi:hypothetical protein
MTPSPDAEVPMSELEAAVAQACELARKPITAYDQFPESDAYIFHCPELAGVHRLHADASPDDASAILRGLAPAIREADPFQASRLALLCGSHVEAGGDPTIAVDAVVDRLPAVLTGAAATLDRLGDGADPADLFAENPDTVKSWKALRYFVLPAMAMLTRDMAARQRARTKPDLREAIDAVEPHQTDARFLGMTLDLIDGLELLVLHPGQGKGFRVELEAVASNPHLFTLLQGELLGEHRLDGPEPDSEAVGVAGGWVLPDRHVSDRALFHFYDWSGLDADPDSDVLHLGASVWADGRPDQIPEFEGARVVLLGPPVFGLRGWDSSFFPLFHDALRPDVRVTEELTPEQVADWLGRIREAIRAAGV